MLMTIILPLYHTDDLALANAYTSTNLAGSMISEIKISHSPTAIAIDHNTNKVYIANKDGSISVISDSGKKDISRLRRRRRIIKIKSKLVHKS
jgi:DNA-binding beta-propeller fold protein YncE